MKGGYTKYRGVYFYGKNRPRAPKPWVSSIHLRDGARRYLGCFATQQEAALAYDKALVERDGPHAATNQSTFCEDFGNGDHAIAAKDDNLNGSVAVDGKHDSDDDVVFVMEIKGTPSSIAQRLTRKRRKLNDYAVTHQSYPEGIDIDGEQEEEEHVQQAAGNATGVAGTAHDVRRPMRRGQQNLARSIADRCDSPRSYSLRNAGDVKSPVSTCLKRDTRSGQRAKPKRAKLAPATPKACERKQKPATKQSRRRFLSLLSSQRDDAGSDTGTDSEDLPQSRTSKYKGVHWDPKMAVWFARIRDSKSGEYRILGYHEREGVAALAYDLAVLQIHGSRAPMPNADRFPEDFPDLQADAQTVTSSGARRQSTSNRKGKSGGDNATAQQA